MLPRLSPEQKLAVNELKNRGPKKVIWAPVGVGKTYISLGYFLEYSKTKPLPLIVITTAKKRDSNDWQETAKIFGIDGIVVDSWNNIRKYLDISGFYIFDEAKGGGNGKWGKAFIKIGRKNPWLLLSATPGDVWIDWANVFVAAGYFRSVTEFRRKHVVYAPFIRYPKIDHYVGTNRLNRLRKDISIRVYVKKERERITEGIKVKYNVIEFKRIKKHRQDISGKPYENISELFFALRKATNNHPSRLGALLSLFERHRRLIVFYNYDFEIEAMRKIFKTDIFREYNGKKHDSIPDISEWLYAVHYAAGAEGWNCVETNALCFYSLPYSYKKYEQAMGRIDRMNSPFDKLYYYYLYSDSPIDKAIRRALNKKKDFNIKGYLNE